MDRPCGWNPRDLIVPVKAHTRMFQVTRQIDFCYGHRLLNYDGKCRHLHGHNARVVITLQSEQLDANGMVMDFGQIKRKLSHWIDENLDHRMILSRQDPVADLLLAAGEPLHLIDANPTAENIAKLIHDVARGFGFPIVQTQLWETPRCYATYRSDVTR